METQPITNSDNPIPIHRFSSNVGGQTPDASEEPTRYERERRQESAIVLCVMDGRCLIYASDVAVLFPNSSAQVLLICDIYPLAKLRFGFIVLPFAF